MDFPHDMGYLDQLPLEIRVRQYCLKLKVDPTLDTDGLFDPIHGTISIRPAVPQYAAEVIFHEILHAIHCSLGNAETLTEEQVASGYSGALLEVIRDNPALMRWIVLAVPDSSFSAPGR